MPVYLHMRMGGDDVPFFDGLDGGDDLFGRHSLIESDSIAPWHAMGGTYGLDAGEAQTDFIGQGSKIVGLCRADLLNQPVQTAPAFGVVRAPRGAFRAIVEQVELVIASDDSPVGGAHDVDDVVVERHWIDQVAVEYDVVGLQSFQFGEDGLQRGKISVNVGEDCQSHGSLVVWPQTYCGILPAMLPGGNETVKRELYENRAKTVLDGSASSHIKCIAGYIILEKPCSLLIRGTAIFDRRPRRKLAGFCQAASIGVTLESRLVDRTVGGPKRNRLCWI